MLGFLKRKSHRDEAQKTEKGIERTKKTWWGKVVNLFDRSVLDDDVWEELEELLIAADVGVDTTDQVISRLRERVKKEKVEEAARARIILEEEIIALLSVNGGETPVSEGGLEIILVVGVNGVGKTTSIAKLAYNLKQDGKRVILAASDTFRAAAIDQLKIWGERLAIPVIAHQQGGDPGAVLYDAIEAARKNTDVVIVDTAGRLHTKYNLMEELKKIRRVATKAGVEPAVLLVLDANTGQNGLSQARHFTEAVNVDGIILAKLDSTAKGGIILAICNELRIPILYIGTGQELDDLAPFDPEEFTAALFSR